MSWTWRVETSSGEPAALPFEVPEFPSQSDAESWVGETWRDLADAGRGQVAHDTAGCSDHDRVGRAHVALDGASDGDARAGDRADHGRVGTEREVTRHAHVALDPTQDLERGVPANVAPDDGGAADD